jgi:serine protease
MSRIAKCFVAFFAVVAFAACGSGIPQTANSMIPAGAHASHALSHASASRQNGAAQPDDGPCGVMGGPPHCISASPTPSPTPKPTPTPVPTPTPDPGGDGNGKIIN